MSVTWLFFAALATMFLNFYWRHWALALAAMFLVIGVMVDQGVTDWFRWASLVLFVLNLWMAAIGLYKAAFKGK